VLSSVTSPHPMYRLSPLRVRWNGSWEKLRKVFGFFVIRAALCSSGQFLDINHRARMREQRGLMETSGARMFYRGRDGQRSRVHAPMDNSVETIARPVSGGDSIENRVQHASRAASSESSSLRNRRSIGTRPERPQRTRGPEYSMSIRPKRLSLVRIPPSYFIQYNHLIITLDWRRRIVEKIC